MGMTVAQLKQGLERKKASKSGVKNVLVQHLITAQNACPPPSSNLKVANESQNENIADEANYRSNDLQAFHPNDRRRETERGVQKPERPANLQGPSVSADEDEFKNFKEWDRPPFTGLSKV